MRITVSYTLSTDEVAKLFRKVAFRAVLRMLPFILGIILAGVVEMIGHEVGLGIGFIALPSAYLLSAPLGVRRAIAKNAPLHQGPAFVALSDQSVAVTRPLLRSEVRWEAISKIEDFGGWWILYRGTKKGTTRGTTPSGLLPKRAFGVEDTARIEAFFAGLPRGAADQGEPGDVPTWPEVFGGEAVVDEGHSGSPVE